MKRIIAAYRILLLLPVLHLCAHAQETNPAKQFDNWKTNTLQEKLFVHTDKGFYMAGEIIWFKVYATDASANRPLDMSRVCYVEILSRDHKPVLQAKISMHDATGSGSFQLPYSVNSGNYIFRAYTNWMKNSSADFFFEKNITIVNGLKKPDWNEQTAADNYDVQFFPEGGNMVNGMESRIAFRVVNAYGKSIQCSGAVLNSRNDTVARFSTLRFGIGSFDFTPVSGENYHAVVTVNGTAVNKTLPSAFAKGLVMRVDEVNNDKINLIIQNNTGTKNISLLVHAKGTVSVSTAYQVTNGKTVIELDKKQLGEGISHFTIFDDANKPVAERLYFRKPAMMQVGLSSDAQQYTKRKKVTVDISTNNEQQLPVTGNMSASVYMLDSLQTIEQTDIYSYLWLQSELKGNIESPAYYFIANGTEAITAADNLMLTQGWSRFRWESMAQTDQEFLPEVEGQVITGKVVDKSNNNAASGITAYLSVPSEKALFENTLSRQNGLIRFNVKNFYGRNEIIVQPDSASDKYRVDIANPFSEKFSAKYVPAFSLTEQQATVLTAHSIESQVGNTYYADKQQQFVYPRYMDTMPFYGVPDNRYYLDDYTRFITMEEVIREYVTNVHLQKRDNKFRFRVYDLDYANFFDTDPLILLDGVPVSDGNTMATFDPLKIKRIDVVAHKFYRHNQLHNGIVNFSTYQGDLAGYQLDPNALIVEYEGMQLQREFFSPVYETQAQVNSRLPDFRNQLFWSPEIHTGKDGKQQLNFYTGDLPGTYAIVLQGINADGLCGSKTITFTVR